MNFSRYTQHLTTMTSIAIAVILGSSLQSQPIKAQETPVDIVARREAKRDWMQAELTLNNSRYAATRAQIDKLIRKGRKPAQLEQTYRLRGNNRYDRYKIFRWAYAAYRKQKLSPDANGLIRLEEAMNRNLQPGAYDWVRLRFLVSSLQTFQRPTMPLIKVGRRLLNVEKNDEEVLFHFVRNLQASQLLKDREQAITIARANAQKHPRDLYWQWMLADSIDFANDFAGRPTYEGNQASIAQYKKTLKMLPTGHSYRRRLIEKLVRLDLDFDANGRPVAWNRKAYREALKNTNLK